VVGDSMKKSLLRWRARLVPEELGLGWMPVYNLGYLIFLFLPLLFDPMGRGKAFGLLSNLLWPTLVSLIAFLWLYFSSFRSTGLPSLLKMLGIAGLGYYLLPFNTFANTYIIYAIGAAPFLRGSLGARMGWSALVLALFCIEVMYLDYSIFVFAITLIIAVAVFFGNYFFIENARKAAELKLSHEEVRRLAALAERERIGRDLHDLLGHTLSLIALKSELAGKLVDRDALAARREIDEVSKVARDTLSQVRRAVTGIRAAGLAAELASAKLLLESAGVRFRYELGEVALPAELETTLALIVREAVTNIQRHAQASSARIEVQAEDGLVALSVEDNGRGSDMNPGNGLRGMRERVEILGGRLCIDSVVARGTKLIVTIPVPEGTTAPLNASITQVCTR
jgi:two-component system sensor histidine kinase DesK